MLRSLAFYLTFYLGSVGHVSVILVWAALGNHHRFVATVRGWVLFHRACARVLVGIHHRVEGTIPPGPVLFALKHESFYEAIDIPALLPDAGVFAKAALLKIPGWGKAAGHYGVVPVERDQGARALRAMLAEARRITGAGRSLAIFPEGTRVPHGDKPALQAGFAGVYKLLNLPVVAVAVNSGPLYHRWWKRPGVVTFHFSDPIPPGLPREEIEARVISAINALNQPE